MKIPNINPAEIKIIPTKKKFERTVKFINTISDDSGFPKEQPIESPVYIASEADVIQKIKNKIQIAIDNMTR